MVSEWSARCSKRGDPMSCVNAIENPLAPPRRAAEPDGQEARLRLDRPHLPAAQASRLVALLRLQRCTSRTARRRDDLRSGAAESRHAGHLEPAAVVHDRQEEPPAAKHPVSTRYFYRAARKAGPCRRSPGSCPSYPVSEHPHLPITAGQAYVTSVVNAVMRRPRLGQLERNLPRVGRLGRVLRPRRPADGRPERLRPAGAGPRDQPVRAGRASSTTRC